MSKVDAEFTERLEAGLEFEDYIAECYRRRGWRVFHRGRERQGADLGIDIVAVKDDRNVLIQCKRWSLGREIAPDVVATFIRDAEAYQRRRGHAQPMLGLWQPATFLAVIATTTTLTDAAKTLALAKGVVVRENVIYPLAEPTIDFATSEAGEFRNETPPMQVYAACACTFDAPEPPSSPWLFLGRIMGRLRRGRKGERLD